MPRPHYYWSFQWRKHINRLRSSATKLVLPSVYLKFSLSGEIVWNFILDYSTVPSASTSRALILPNGFGNILPSNAPVFTTVLPDIYFNSMLIRHMYWFLEFGIKSPTYANSSGMSGANYEKKVMSNYHFRRNSLAAYQVQSRTSSMIYISQY